MCEAALAQVARKLGVGRVLRMDKGEELTGGRDKPSVLADAMEAILAAVYLDGGMEEAPPHGAASLAQSGGGTASHAGQQGRAPGVSPAGWRRGATYRIIGQDGPPHDRRFTAQVLRDQQPLAQGTGRTKKQAEQAAALAALQALQASK